MRQKVEQLKLLFDDEISKLTSNKDLEQMRVSYLGKKGTVTALLKELGTLDASQKKNLVKY